jgi:hypothetical protein
VQRATLAICGAGSAEACLRQAEPLDNALR